MAELFDCVADGSLSHTFMQYSITFSSRPEAAIDVIAGEAGDKVGVDVHVNFGDSRSNVLEIFEGLIS